MTATNNYFGDFGGAAGPMLPLHVVDVIGFGPAYVSSAVVPTLAGIALFAGLCRQTGTVRPATGREQGTARRGP